MHRYRIELGTHSDTSCTSTVGPVQTEKTHLYLLLELVMRADVRFSGACVKYRQSAVLRLATLGISAISTINVQSVMDLGLALVQRGLVQDKVYFDQPMV